MTITAVFGIEDATTATLAYTEAVDVCAMDALVTEAATLALTESPDISIIMGSVIGTGSIVTTEAPDVMAISALALVSATIATTEHPDICAIEAIAPNSIITYPDPRYGIRVDQSDFRVVVDRSLAEV